MSTFIRSDTALFMRILVHTYDEENKVKKCINCLGLWLHVWGFTVLSSHTTCQVDFFYVFELLTLFIRLIKDELPLILFVFCWVVCAFTLKGLNEKGQRTCECGVAGIFASRIFYKSNYHRFKTYSNRETTTPINIYR